MKMTGRRKDELCRGILNLSYPTIRDGLALLDKLNATAQEKDEIMERMQFIFEDGKFAR